VKAAAILSLVALISLKAVAQVELCNAGKEFVSKLSADQKSKANFKDDDNERFNWNFVPTTRRGLPVGDLNDDQRKLLQSLLSASLAEQGLTKANNITSLEGILRDVEGRGNDDTYRDPKKYFVSIFGTPDCKGVWHWRLEGHHLSLNFSIIDGAMISSTPSFMGANPAVVPSGSKKGWEVLKAETDLGFALIQALTVDQQKKAIFSSSALPEIVTGNDRRAKLIEPAGIYYRELNAEQKKAFIRLLDVFVKNYELGFSSKLWEKIQKSGVDNLSFAWAGSTSPGSGTYYRIQGPMLQIEYDNTQTRANHVHTAVRDLTNDFAEDVLKSHYQKEH
jgi:Protein of unknown function (DUF3500)